MSGNMDTVLDPNYEWLYLKDAWKQLPRGTDISMNQFRVWCKSSVNMQPGKHGIVAGRFGGLIMVRSDTIPQVEGLK